MKYEYMNFSQFEEEVARIINILDRNYEDQVISSNDVLQIKSANTDDIKKTIIKSCLSNEDLLSKELGEEIEASPEEFELATNESIRILHDRGIKKHICAMLKSVTDDTFEVSKILISVLLPLSISGTVLIPINPIIYGFISIVISRMGIALYCKNPASSNDSETIFLRNPEKKKK